MKEVIINAETGEVSERVFSQKEIEELIKTNAESKAKFDAIQQKQNEKFAILEKLGLSEEEARLLLS